MESNNNELHFKFICRIGSSAQHQIFLFSKTQENCASYLEEKGGETQNTTHTTPPQNVKITYAPVETKRRPKLDYLQATELSIKYFAKPPIQSNFC